MSVCQLDSWSHKVLPSLYFFSIQRLYCRRYSSWDYNQNVGLVVVGGYGITAKNLNISRDLRTVKTLTDIPYLRCGQYSNSMLQSACVVIINETSIFVAGGMGE